MRQIFAFGSEQIMKMPHPSALQISQDVLVHAITGWLLAAGPSGLAQLGKN